MCLTANYFYKLNLNSVIVNSVKDFIYNSKESDWHIFLEQDILLLPEDIFKSDNQIYQLIKHFGCEKRLGIYRFQPNFSYGWHTDLIRHVAVNMLIDGWNSKTYFSKASKIRLNTNLQEVPYEENKYILMNVKELHSVFNLDNLRYVISIGIPPPATFQDVSQYVKDTLML